MFWMIKYESRCKIQNHLYVLHESQLYLLSIENPHLVLSYVLNDSNISLTHMLLKTPLPLPYAVGGELNQ